VNFALALLVNIYIRPHLFSTEIEFFVVVDLAENIHPGVWQHWRCLLQCVGGQQFWH
jgi:hypothetical protein